MTAWYSVLVLLYQKVVKILKVPNKIDDEAEGKYAIYEISPSYEDHI